MAQGLDDGGLSRRDLLRRGAAGAFVLSSGSLLAACGAGSGVGSGGGSTNGGSVGTAATPAFSDGPASGGTPTKGQTLNVGFVTGGAAETIDPRKALVNGDLARCYCLYDLLFNLKPGGYTPALAEEASSSKDAKIWKLKLRRGVTWHDGKPFTADDVVFTLQQNWGGKINFGGVAVALIMDFKNVRKLDTYTVEVPLLRGVAEFPLVCAATNLWVTQNGTTDWTNGLGTGPFMLESFTAGSQSVFKSNPNYWGGAPHLAKLVINSSFASDNPRFNALLAGDIDIAPQVPQALAKANAASGQIVLGNQPAPGFIAPTMHITRPPFTDLRVRQALRLLADREAAVSEVFSGYGTPGNDCMGQTLPYWASSLHRTPDVEKAKSLLKKAGQENLSLLLYTSDLVPGVNESATLYAQQATAGGVKISLKTVDPSVYYTSSSPGGTWPNKTFSMNQWALGMPCLSYLYLLAQDTSGPFDETGFGSKHSNSLLYEALAETDTTKAKDKWMTVQELQFNQGGYIILANITFLDGYTPKVRGVKTTSSGPCDNYDFSGAWLT